MQGLKFYHYDMSRKIIFKFAAIFALSLLLTLLVESFFHISFSDLKNFIRSFGVLSPVIYSLTLFLGLTVPFNPVPDVLVVNLAALLFPPLVAVLATLAAQVASLTVNYFLARHFADNILRKVLSDEEFSYVENLSKNLRPRIIFGLRFVLPLTAIGIDVVSYASGFAKVAFERFLIASLVPWTFYSLVYFFSTNYLKSINPWLFFLPLVLIIGIPILIFGFTRRDTVFGTAKNFLKKP